MHKIDTFKVKGIVAITIQYQRESDLAIVTINGEDHMNRVNIPQLQYHSPGCGYSNIKDDSIRKHRRNCHSSFQELVDELGTFWATIKTHFQAHNDFPPTSQVLNERKVVSCSQFFLNQENARIHMSSKHRDIEVKDQTDHLEQCFLTYAFEDRVRISIVQDDSHVELNGISINTEMIRLNGE